MYLLNQSIFIAYRMQQPNQHNMIVRTTIDPNNKATCSALYANPSTLLGSTMTNHYNSSHDQRNLMNHSRW